MRGWLVSVAIVALGCFSWFVWRRLNNSVPTTFRANLHTRRLTFVAGANPDSAGIFNSDFDRVTLTLTNPARLEPSRPDNSTGPPDRPAMCVANTVLDSIKLASISIPEDLHVALDAEPDGRLRYTLTSPPRTPDPTVTVALDNRSDTSHLACDTKLPKHPVGEWRIRPSEPNEPIEFLVSFLPPKASPFSAHDSPSYAPSPEERVVLASPTRLLLDCAPVDEAAPCELRLIRSGRKIEVKDGLVLKDLSGASIQQLAFDPAHTRLSMAVVGSAKYIGVEVGQEEISQADLVYSAFKPKSLSGFVSSMAGIAGAIIALVAWLRPRTANKPPDQ